MTHWLTFILTSLSFHLCYSSWMEKIKFQSFENIRQNRATNYFVLHYEPKEDVSLLHWMCSVNSYTFTVAYISRHTYSAYERVLIHKGINNVKKRTRCSELTPISLRYEQQSHHCWFICAPFCVYMCVCVCGSRGITNQNLASPGTKGLSFSLLFLRCCRPLWDTFIFRLIIYYPYYASIPETWIQFGEDGMH